ncbi:hypothetical protein GA829_19510 [Mesorhizobium sp. INR15]|nr:hypothetical protein GA829_19510 [Mesorhizobium sp. INR15]
MAKQPYDVRTEPDGTWTVFDKVTGLPAMFDGATALGMGVEEADVLVDLLNACDRSDRKAQETQ